MDNNIPPSFCQHLNRFDVLNNFVQGESWAEPSNIFHVLHRIPAPLTDQELGTLVSSINPFDTSLMGIDMYGEAVKFINEKLAS